MNFNAWTLLYMKDCVQLVMLQSSCVLGLGCDLWKTLHAVWLQVVKCTVEADKFDQKKMHYCRLVMFLLQHVTLFWCSKRTIVLANIQRTCSIAISPAIIQG
jgi:hypothetical protein